MKFVERQHDVSELGIGDGGDRHCDNCHDLHEFIVMIVMPGRFKIGKAACPKAQSGYYTQPMTVDYVPRPDED